ncbi:uncharacterized protein EV420DRAFT_1734523 [Desarmillaria tabescens]|uniref:Uncharacterized protein n=1 Tax=Armillaria tabescens TaxID=1929756 RepID=A0AA39NB12_ARMTA|nr:uncharacterized protein EV420DRAFT_1734523 [Desarmillaria tabescens]KAK0462318.1 hypothetical protein EV420DRAFT_1734523 [Desarmillaria tabescens]
MFLEVGKFNDSIWTALWCTGIMLCSLFSIIMLFTTPTSDRKPGVTLPYTILLHTVPLITILTFVSAFVAYTHVLLSRIFVRPVMIITFVFIPAALFISAIWAFVGSFMWDGDTKPTWGETTALHLFSLIPLALSILTAQRLFGLPRDIHSTSLTLTLSTQLLMANPLFLVLSPTILLATLLASIPFITLIFHLLLIEYFISLSDCFSPDALLPPSMSTHMIHAALMHSTGPSLGTVVLLALILIAIRLLMLLTVFF